MCVFDHLENLPVFFPERRIDPVVFCQRELGTSVVARLIAVLVVDRADVSQQVGQLTLVAVHDEGDGTFLKR